MATPKLTPRHRAANAALEGDRPSVTILRGAAGTGKTYAAISAAVGWQGGGLVSNKASGKKKIVVIRPNVAFAKDIGFLPGEKDDKMAPWVQPVVDNLKTMGFPSGKIADALANEAIEVVPLAYVQGRTFHNSFVIVDECQNMTEEQLFMCWTRLGDYSKIVYCGDEKQVAGSVHRSGLSELARKCEPYPVNIITFTKEDNLRSPLSKLGLEVQDSK